MYVIVGRIIDLHTVVSFSVRLTVQDIITAIVSNADPSNKLKMKSQARAHASGKPQKAFSNADAQPEEHHRLYTDILSTINREV